MSYNGSVYGADDRRKSDLIHDVSYSLYLYISIALEIIGLRASLFSLKDFLLIEIDNKSYFR